MSMPGGLKETANSSSLAEASSFRTWAPVSIAGWVLRELFIILFVILTARVTIPETEIVWRAYESPADLFRVILGLAVCAWLAKQLFRIPKDPQACRTWFFVGLAAVPFALICVVCFW